MCLTEINSISQGYSLAGLHPSIQFLSTCPHLMLPGGLETPRLSISNVLQGLFPTNRRLFVYLLWWHAFLQPSLRSPIFPSPRNTQMKDTSCKMTGVKPASVGFRIWHPFNCGFLPGSMEWYVCTPGRSGT